MSLSEVLFRETPRGSHKDVRELMSNGRELDYGYTSEVDILDQETWHRALQEFDDANIYQTWAYGTIMSGAGGASHLVLRHHGEIVAMAMVRIAKLPFINVGVAYIGSGPLWRRRATSVDANVFQQMLRALRNEFVCSRRLVLRIFPSLFRDDSSVFCAALAEEGFAALRKQTVDRTILMDLTPEIGELRAALGRNWRRNLKQAEQGGLEVVDGTEEALFDAVIKVYREMVSRKKFVEPNDIERFKMVQARLPETLRMRIMLCKAKGDVCAALVWTAMGKTGIELFAATSDEGIQTRGASHLLRWRLVEKLREAGVATYDLNGINPQTNPGTYRFKSDLAGKNGKDVYYLGRFDSSPGVLAYSLIECGDAFRGAYRKLRELTRTRRPARHGGGGAPPE